MIESPFNLSSNTFSNETYRQGTLHIPTGTMSLYTSFDGWRNFLNIEEMDDESNPISLTIMDATAGSTKIRVKKGDNYTLAFLPEKDWKLNSVTFNDEDVTSQLDDQGYFTTPSITTDAVLRVVYEQLNTQVAGINYQDVSMKAIKGGVRIDNANDGSICQVYTTDGKLVNTAIISGNSITISIPEGQVYIVKVGGKTLKAAL